MPELHLKGKQFVYNHHLTVPYRPLIVQPDKSLGDNPENLIIHGDNLHALKALLPRYAGNVDCIFIDPPYNTGNENCSYNDNVNKITTVGELELVYDPATTVTCALVYQDHWQTDLAGIVRTWKPPGSGRLPRKVYTIGDTCKVGVPSPRFFH